MEHRAYHREELDTTEEIVNEFQKLRDIVESQDERIEALENQTAALKKKLKSKD